MTSFDHLETYDYLDERDFTFFYTSFREVVVRTLPRFNDLFFVRTLEEAEKYIASQDVLNKVLDYSKKKENDDSFFYCHDTTLVFSVASRNRPVLSVVTGVDSYFIGRVSIDWLEDLKKSIQFSFLLIKRAGIDLETGMLNSRQLFAMLRNIAGKPSPALVLIELYPRARSSRESEIHTAKAVRSLQGCVPTHLPVFYLGHHVFAVLSESLGRNGGNILAKKLLSWLRRDGFRKIHIGLRCNSGDSIHTGEKNHLLLFDQVRNALQTARKRGPFAVCDYDHIKNDEEHPLRKPSKRIMAKFRRRWQQLDSFSIVQFQSSSPKTQNIVQVGLRSQQIISDTLDIYALLPDMDAQQALQWSRKKITELDGVNVNIGVAYYPYSSFSKSQTVFNCRKALNHAAFFGLDGSVIFDEVSLNISGDIYYAEGDLTSAVREYKAGLLCDPKNINLLNSLGVTYGDMDKHKEARDCFDSVLLLDEQNFMALFNAGLSAEVTGHHTDAVDYFEKALTLNTDFTEVREDLAFQLGRLYCEVGRYDEAVGILLPWYKKNEDNPLGPRAHSYLGRSYHGTSQYRQAMKWLQRALKYDEFDALSMGLLGHTYLLAGEGDDIALSLCAKSVDLDPHNILLKMYLAKVQIACNLHDQARTTLTKCLRNSSTRQEAQLLSSMNYKRQGQTARAGFWLNKLLNNKHLNQELSRKVKKLQEEIDGI